MLMILFSTMLQLSAGMVAERTAIFTQEEMQWPVVLSARGEVSGKGRELLIKLRDIKVADQPADPNSTPYSGYRECLARETSGGGWEKTACSEPVKLPIQVDSDRTVSLPSRKLSIDVSGQPSLAGCWLVIEMTPWPVQGKPLPSVFAHSQRSIFGPAAGG